MKIVNGEFINEIEIEKSRFITYLKRINSIDEANEFINLIRKKHWDASHNCLALVLGEKGEIMRSSDDGEPSKTAGIPMLEVLKKNNVTDTVCITTRYFGGIKLGAGGLVRAYTKSVSEALKKANYIEIRILKCFDITINYSIYNTLLPLIKDNVIDTKFSDNVIVTIAIMDESVLNKITDISLGTAIIHYQKDISLDVSL